MCTKTKKREAFVVLYVFSARKRPLEPPRAFGSACMAGLSVVGTVIGSRHLPFTLMCICIIMLGLAHLGPSHTLMQG